MSSKPLVYDQLGSKAFSQILFMRYNIKVIPNAKEDSIIDQNGVLTVRTTEPPVYGRANAAVLELLTAYFGKPVHLVAGAKSRKKVVEVE